jgi:response regulator of citrate/malate metabolism
MQRRPAGPRSPHSSADAPLLAPLLDSGFRWGNRRDPHRLGEPGLIAGEATTVLVVEDEAVAAHILANGVAAARGFAVVGRTCSGADALRQMVSHDAVDLVLLDIQLPDMSGMDVLRRLRASGCDVDVMVVTVLRDPSMLQAAMALGVVHYLLKPFTAATLQRKLERYRAFRARRLAGAGHPIAQHEIDGVFTALRAMAADALPRGVGHESLNAVTGQLRRSKVRSAAQIAEALGTSRVTARRYLEHLTDCGLAERGSRYGGSGRPEVEYRWSGNEG